MATNGKQLDMMWQFLQIGQQKSNVPLLKKYCEQLRRLMMQKTAGQRGMNGDIPFEDLGTITNVIVVEALCLYLSGDLDRLEKQDE